MCQGGGGSEVRAVEQGGCHGSPDITPAGRKLDLIASKWFGEKDIAMCYVIVVSVSESVTRSVVLSYTFPVVFSLECFELLFSKHLCL